MKFLRNANKTKILSIVALVVAIVGMSLGFAAFSTALTIFSSATVTPDSATFGVKFSTNKDSLVEDPVSPSSKTDGITATNGVINNSANPILTNLSATFSEPGQYAEYTFYARNEGSYTAYLNNINFLGKKVCRGKTGTTESLVESACDSISISAKIGNADTKYTETTPITNHSLGSGEGEEIVVRIEYVSGGAYVDGDFSITFPDVSLVYSTIDDSTMSGNVVRLESGSLDEEGSIVSIGNEQFYVIGRNAENDTVKLLARYNLYVGNQFDGTITPLENPTGIQDERAIGGIWIDEDGIDPGYPWIGVVNFRVKGSGLSYTGSIVEGHVNNYKSYLESLGVNMVSASSITVDELVDLGCSVDDRSCTSAPSWVYSTSYWTSSASEDFGVFVVDRCGMYNRGGYYPPEWSMGVRPVIEISLSEF